MLQDVGLAVMDVAGPDGDCWFSSVLMWLPERTEVDARAVTALRCIDERICSHKEVVRIGTSGCLVSSDDIVAFARARRQECPSGVVVVCAPARVVVLFHPDFSQTVMSGHAARDLLQASMTTCPVVLYTLPNGLHKPGHFEPCFPDRMGTRLQQCGDPCQPLCANRIGVPILFGGGDKDMAARR